MKLKIKILNEDTNKDHQNKRRRHNMSNIEIRTIYKPDGIYLKTTAYGGKN